MAAERLPVPAYLPELLPDSARPLIEWTRRHVQRVTNRYPNVSVDDLWDEAITALIRASLYYKEERSASPRHEVGKSTAFGRYATTAIHRACWRYCVRGSRTEQFDPLVCWEEWSDREECKTWEDRHRHWWYGDMPTMPALDAIHAPSPEDWMIARESVQTFVPPPEPSRKRREKSA